MLKLIDYLAVAFPLGGWQRIPCWSVCRHRPWRTSDLRGSCDTHPYPHQPAPPDTKTNYWSKVVSTAHECPAQLPVYICTVFLINLRWEKNMIIKITEKVKVWKCLHSQVAYTKNYPCMKFNWISWNWAKHSIKGEGREEGRRIDTINALWPWKPGRPQLHHRNMWSRDQWQN